MASVQVYLGHNATGRPTAVGTHADLVARCVGDPYSLDPVSVCDFLNAGIPCCPHTMHTNVTELSPGTAYVFWTPAGQAAVRRDFQYWIPPNEVDRRRDERTLVEEFAVRWQRELRDAGAIVWKIAKWRTGLAACTSLHPASKEVCCLDPVRQGQQGSTYRPQGSRMLWQGLDPASQGPRILGANGRRCNPVHRV